MLKIKNLQINGTKLVKMGYSGQKIKIILDDVTKQVITNKLRNDEQFITEYINRRYRI